MKFLVALVMALMACGDNAQTPPSVGGSVGGSMQPVAVAYGATPVWATWLGKPDAFSTAVCSHALVYAQEKDAGNNLLNRYRLQIYPAWGDNVAPIAKFSVPNGTGSLSGASENNTGKWNVSAMALSCP